MEKKETINSESPPLIERIPLQDIVPSPDQPRINFDEDYIKSLAEDIKRKGLIQAVVVRPSSNGKFILVVGECRLRAHILLREHPEYFKGIATDFDPNLIRAEIRRDLTEKDALEMTLTENTKRKDLDIKEQAMACRHLKEVRGYPINEIARLMNLSPPTIYNRIHLLEFSERIGDLNIGGRKSTLIDLIREGKLTRGDVLNLAQYSGLSEDQKESAKLAIELAQDKITPEQLKVKLLQIKTQTKFSPVETSNGEKIPFPTHPPKLNPVEKEIRETVDDLEKLNSVLAKSVEILRKNQNASSSIIVQAFNRLPLSVQEHPLMSIDSLHELGDMLIILQKARGDDDDK